MTFNSTSRTSVKDAMESLGIPHTEVRLILVNNTPATLNQLLQAHDVVHLYPPHHHPAVEEKYLLPWRPKKTRFVIDVHLSRLNSYLRLGGFDCTYFTDDVGDERLAQISAEQQRILLTRDIGLLKRSIVQYGHWLHSTAPREQLREVVLLYRLQNEFRPFTRCSLCNGKVNLVNRNEIEDVLPDSLRDTDTALWHCEDCHKVYWKGSHYTKVMQLFHEAGACLSDTHPQAQHQDC